MMEKSHSTENIHPGIIGISYVCERSPEMQYIIYDLEFTVSRNARYSSEIIDIGAVKVLQGDDGLYVADTFHSFVRPSNRPVLSTDTVQFTGITQRDIDAAPLFPEAVKHFIAWLGTDTPYFLCAWGPDDRQKLVSHCRTHHVDLGWIHNTNDIQKQISRILGPNGKYRQLSLSQALELCNIDFDGQQHRALDDAVNTAQVFMRHFDRLVLTNNAADDEESRGSKLVYSTPDEEQEQYSPFGNLANLFKDR
jgi:inhibitor of KinA sporulation pathway (predicted exonuclease)